MTSLPHTFLVHVPVLLPTAITDTVIDHLHDDKRSLFSVALVSHQTLPSAQLHLFRSLKITDGMRRILSGRLVDFLEYHPQLATYVKRLCWDFFGIPAKDIPPLSRLLRILDLLPSLRHLSLLRSSFVSLDCLEEEWSKGRVPRNISLESLVIDLPGRDVYGDDATLTVPEVHALLAIFSSVKELHLLNVCPHSVGRHCSLPIVIRPQKLQIIQNPGLQNLPEATGTSFLGSVQVLSLELSERLGWTSTAVLEVMRQHVLTLQINVSPMWRWPMGKLFSLVVTRLSLLMPSVRRSRLGATES